MATRAEVARLIPNARLAVLPGTTHFGRDHGSSQ
jgi:hypothetical protein